jgi:hypothetical protein
MHAYMRGVTYYMLNSPIIAIIHLSWKLTSTRDGSLIYIGQIIKVFELRLSFTGLRIKFNLHI